MVMTELPAPDPLVAHARAYAAAGLEVFPVNPRDKTPLVSQYQATTDLEQINTWWHQWPTALIGHRIAPDVVILDVDPRHGGHDTWRALLEQFPARPVTRWHRSGRGDGGGHTWWLRPADKTTVTGLDAWAQERGLGHDLGTRWSCGIDVLHHRHRYTILPPSPHPDTGRPYTWAAQGLDTPVAPMPALLADLITDNAPVLPPAPPRAPDPDSIADWYTISHHWGDLLGRHGWTLRAGDGNSDGSRWRHPQATNSFSATIRHGCLFVYSPNTPFDVTDPGRPNGYTLFRAYAVLDHTGDLAAAGRAARGDKDGPGPGADLSWIPTPTNGQTPSPPPEGRHVHLTAAAGITPKRVRWCWADRIAVGTIALLAGPEGLGKSTIAYWLAARTTRGELPGEHHGTPRAVLICATEDSWAHTIVPRLMAHGANLKLVYRVEVHDADDGIDLGLSLPVDLAGIAHAAETTGAALLILDPLMSRLDAKLDTHRDGEVRRALEPLAALADDTRLAILGLIHHNKSGSADPLQLVMASKAFTAVARSVHTVIRDPDDDTQLRRFFGTSKNNLGRLDLPTLAFTILPWTYPTDDGEGVTGQITWGEELRESIADALARAARDPDEKSAVDEAAEWLEDYLDSNAGRGNAGAIYTAGRADGHSERTLRRARQKLKIDARKNGFSGGWEWVLPDRPANRPTSPQDPPAGQLARSASTSIDVANKNPSGQQSVSPRARGQIEATDHRPTRPCDRCGNPTPDISGICRDCCF